MNLVANSGFETGNFSSWTLSGNTASNTLVVENGRNLGGFSGPVNAHSGTYSAALGPVTTPGFISQDITTNAALCQLSFYAENLSPETDQMFLKASMDGVLLADASDAPVGQ